MPKTRSKPPPPGSIWVEGGHLHYMDEDGVERRVRGELVRRRVDGGILRNPVGRMGLSGHLRAG